MLCALCALCVCSAGELEFLPNKYLVAADGAPDGRAVLVKSYTFDQGSGSDRLLHSKVVAAPKWTSPSTDPTHKVGRDGKQRPASSIFQLFKAQGGKYAFNLPGSGKEVQVRPVGGWGGGQGSDSRSCAGSRRSPSLWVASCWHMHMHVFGCIAQYAHMQGPCCWRLLTATCIWHTAAVPAGRGE